MSSAEGKANKGARGNFSERMRVALRDPKTGWYYRNNGEWTPDRELARDFQRTAEAIRYALDHKVAGLEMMLLFENSQHDLVVTKT